MIHHETHIHPDTAPLHAENGSLEAIRSTLGTYLEAVSTRTAFGHFFHDDVTLTIMGVDPAHGREAVQSVIRTFHGETFDAVLRVERLICEPGHAAAELVFAGTHTGDFAGIPASGRTVAVPHTSTYDFGPDGRITAIRVYLPMQVLLAQLGAG